MDIDVDRSPASQGMSFQRGVPGVFDGDGPKAAFAPRSGLTRKGGRVAKGPARKRLPVLPLAKGEGGTLMVAGGFIGKPGPGPA